MDLNEAKDILESAGYIVEDTDDWDEADMPIGTQKQRADRVNKHSSFRDLDHKYTDAANFNIKNLFYGVEKELKKVYKKVEIDASNYDDEDKCQTCNYYFVYQKKFKHNFILTVSYYDEDNIVELKLTNDDNDEVMDQFYLDTIDEAIKKVIEFVVFQIRGA